MTLIASLIIIGMPSCYDNNNNTEPYVTKTLDSVNDFTIDSSSLIEPPTFVMRPDNTYVDLVTGRKVKVRVDTVSHSIIDVVTRQPVSFFIDPATKDTFDVKGRRVNNALIRGNHNSWTVNENNLNNK